MTLHLQHQYATLKRLFVTPFTMNKKKFFVILFFSLLVVASIGTALYFFVFNQNTDTRSEAGGRSLSVYKVSSTVSNDFRKNYMADGNPSTAWSSKYYSTPDVTESITIDLGSLQTVDGLLITPRLYGNNIQAFPSTFEIKYGGTPTGLTSVKQVTDYPKPTQFQDVYFQFDAPVVGRYFSLVFTKTTTDDYGGYFVQIAEIKPITTAAASDFVHSISFAKQYGASYYGFNCGDSWMMSQAENGSIYTSSSDGVTQNNNIFYSYEGNRGCSGGSQYFTSNIIYQLTQNPPNVTNAAFTLVSSDPLHYATSSWAHYITNTFFNHNTMYYAIVSVDGKKSGIGKSTDFGATITYNQATPMWDGSLSKPFINPTFLQNGAGYSGNTDGYIYMYGWSGNWGKTNTVILARVNRNADLQDINQYRYYSNGNWTKNINGATDVLQDGDNLGGMGSAIYNPVLQRYFLITFASPAYTSPSSADSRLVIYDAPNPWGPWKRSGTISKTDALWSPEAARVPVDALYNPSFNPAWIDADGSMWISYSDNHPNYTFLYGKITVTR